MTVSRDSRSDRASGHTANLTAVRPAPRSRHAIALRALLGFGLGVGLLAATLGHARAETDREYCERQQGAVRTICLRELKNAPPPAAAAPAPAPAPTAATTAPAADKGGAAGGAAPYKVVDGNKVDANTMEGFRTWRAAACDRCHGPNQEGMVGPSLIASLKTLSKDDFKTVLKSGRLEKGMPSFSTSDKVMTHLDDLYAYLKGRSDGAITSSNVQPMN